MPNSESVGFRIVSVIVLTIIAGFVLAAIIYFNQIKQGKPISIGEASSMTIIGGIVFAIVILLWIWALIRLFFSKKDKDVYVHKEVKPTAQYPNVTTFTSYPPPKVTTTVTSPPVPPTTTTIVRMQPQIIPPPPMVQTPPPMAPIRSGPAPITVQGPDLPPTPVPMGIPVDIPSGPDIPTGLDLSD
jgi:hypothetical protein